MVRELLALKSLPAMAEVDALEARWPKSNFVEQGNVFGEAVRSLRRAIANAEAERKRADEAEKDWEVDRGVRDDLELQIADLTRERDEARRLLKWLKDFTGVILDEVATLEGENGHNAADVIELCEKGGSDGNT